jgi:hypothetical protein
MTVMAIDPGGTSGIAFRLDNGTLLTTTCQEPEQVYELIVQPGLTHVVIERFNAQNIGKWGLHTVRIVGGVYALCYDHKIKYIEHMPQERRPFLNEARELLRGRKTVVHELDATAHLLRYEYDIANTVK